MPSFCSYLSFPMNRWFTRLNCDPSIKASSRIDLQKLKGQHLSFSPALRFSTSELLVMTIQEKAVCSQMPFQSIHKL